MVNINEVEKLLQEANAKIEAFEEFKEAYNKQLAFDFNFLKFFRLHENKVSEILAFFLNKNKSHGQGDIFLREFLNYFGINDDKVENLSTTIQLEESTNENRRIDIYIEIGGFVIAIENKIWAVDQNKQLADYSKYLQGKNGEKFLLLYLTPYGKSPDESSISEENKAELTQNNQYREISYRNDIIPLIEKWIGVCEADNVSYFLKEFKKHLDIRFNGNNSLRLTSKMEELIYKNEKAAKLIHDTYRSINEKLLEQLKTLGRELSSDEIFKINNDIELRKEGVFKYDDKENWKKSRHVYKYGLIKNGNEIWVQIIKYMYETQLNLVINCYFKSENTAFEGYAINFKSENKDKKFRINEKKDRELSNNQIKDEFLDQVCLAVEALQKYGDGNNETR